MESHEKISTITIGMAIFTMLFGAGNIIYPIKAGVLAGDKVYVGIYGFLLSGIALPMLGLVTMILFNGNYQEFFNRIGKVPGFIATLFCMLILGPMLVMPRCITVPYDMLSPFLPHINLFGFSLALSGLTLLITFRKAQIMEFFGKYISWILFGTFGLIIFLGLYHGTTLQAQPLSSQFILFDQFIQGFKTLDLIGALFFAYAIIHLIKKNPMTADLSQKKIMFMCLKGTALAGLLMLLLYAGFSFLGALYAHLLTSSMNGAEMFRTIALEIIGYHGIILLITTILLACLSTLIALTMIFSEYIRINLFDKKLTSAQCTYISLLITVSMSNFGLSNILKWSDPFINFGYPIIITVTIFNLLYKLFGIETIKVPVFCATMIMIMINFYIYVM